MKLSVRRLMLMCCGVSMLSFCVILFTVYRWIKFCYGWTKDVEGFGVLMKLLSGVAELLDVSKVRIGLPFWKSRLNVPSIVTALRFFGFLIVCCLGTLGGFIIATTFLFMWAVYIVFVTVGLIVAGLNGIGQLMLAPLVNLISKFLATLG